MRSFFLNKVEKYISDNGLLNHDSRYLVALSGGADSTALLITLMRLKYKVCAAHCNFNLRGDESNRDEKFCKDLCERIGVEYHCVHFDTKTYASVHKVSIEMAARNLRYSYFHDLCNDINLQGVCVAHHKNDNVETVLLNIIRGTGLRGLVGIKPRNGIVLRPFLCVDRNEIVEYLEKEESQSFVTDSTNLVDNVQRNKIRLSLIPILRDINVSAMENIEIMSEHVKEALKIIKSHVDSAIRRCVSEEKDCMTIDIQTVLKEPSTEYVLWEILSKKGFNKSQVKDIVNNIKAQSGRMWHSDTHDALIDRAKLLVKKSDETVFKDIRVLECGCYVISPTVRMRIDTISESNGFEISKKKNHATLDLQNIEFPLTIRLARAGDRIVPFGMKRSKLVSDYLTDIKANLFERKSQLVVEDAKGDIIWLVGRRTNNHYAIWNGTRNVLSLTLECHEQGVGEPYS